MLNQEKTRIPLRWILVGIALMGIILLSVVFIFLDDLRSLDVDLKSMIGLIQDNGPLIFFTALALLPLIGMPVSIFYLVAGASFGLPLSIGGAAVALAINISLSYWIARNLLRRAVELLLSHTHFKIPQVRGNNYVMLTLFVRIMPGVPFFLQSYLLGIAQVPFRIYFLISWSVAFLSSMGMIILGNSFQSSNVGQAVFAVFLVVALLIMVRLIRQRLKDKKSLVDLRTPASEEGQI